MLIAVKKQTVVMIQKITKIGFNHKKKESKMKFNFTDEAKRLDVFLQENLPEITRSRIKNLITDGQVLVNQKVIDKAGYKLKMGDIVEMEVPEPESSEVVAEDIPLEIIYQDSDFAIINKPKGMVVHPAVKNTKGTLVNALLYNIKDLSGINGVVRPGIVHRLDKDTSGLLVIAKNDTAHVELSKQIATKECRRIYRAILEGNLKEDSGEVVTYMERSKKNRLKMAVSDKGKLAHTLYKVLGHYGKFDYVEFELKTGRTHQIRVHSEHLHHPILGDKLYGAKHEKYHKYGQFLHAYKLILTHPSTGEEMQFEAPLPKYFQDFVDNLK